MTCTEGLQYCDNMGPDRGKGKWVEMRGKGRDEPFMPIKLHCGK